MARSLSNREIEEHIGAGGARYPCGHYVCLLGNNLMFLAQRAEHSRANLQKEYSEGPNSQTIGIVATEEFTGQDDGIPDTTYLAGVRAGLEQLDMMPDSSGDIREVLNQRGMHLTETP